MRFRAGLAVGATLFAAAIPLISAHPVSAKPIVCPDTWTGIKCDYYKDGYKAGRRDRKANMSMAYERHNDSYDSRNESYYQAGYEDGWKGTSL
ncbi:MAG: hypothetical protein VKI42_06615 [Synechococcaceae cyanobacterium]|nr:hypothetical protein [Synechococcaceae cyanobacterium]